MQVNNSQLQAHITKPLMPVYLISGDDPLLSTETRDMLRKASI